jgi:hypothetical protein
MQGLFGASLSEIASYSGPLMAGERGLEGAGLKLRVLSEQAVNYHTNVSRLSVIVAVTPIQLIAYSAI